MPLHSALTGSELHENKGVSTAGDDTVATAASGATVWQKVNEDMIDTSSIFTTNRMVLQATITDVSTAETVYIPMPFNCTVDDVYTVLQNSITTADAVVTCRNHTGNSMGTLTIAYSGSAAGDVDTLSPTANNSFIAGERMSIETDGASSTTQRLFITVYVTVTG